MDRRAKGAWNWCAAPCLALLLAGCGAPRSAADRDNSPVVPAPSRPGVAQAQERPQAAPAVREEAPANEDAIAGWVIRPIDPVGTAGTESSIAIDSHGVPHIAYAANQLQIRHAYPHGDRWALERFPQGDPGLFPALVLSADDTVHLVFQASLPSPRLLIARRVRAPAQDQTRFEVETVDGTAGAGAYASAEPDGQGHAKIAYLRGRERAGRVVGQVWIAERTGDRWSRRRVPGAHRATSVDLALGPEASVHAAYTTTDGAAHYLRQEQGSWVHEEITGARARGALSIALSGGEPHVLFVDSETGALRHAERRSGGWELATVDATSRFGAHSALCTDEDGDLHATYFDVEERDLRYARRAGDAWSTEIVDAVGSVGASSSLTVDAQGRPHIAYFNADDWALMYAVRR